MCFPSQKEETKGGFDVYPHLAAKNNPCIFLPRKKKQKAAAKKTRRKAGPEFYLNSTNFTFVFSHVNASIGASHW